MSRWIVLTTATLAAAAGLGVQAATGSPHLLVGLYDEAQTLYGNPDKSFPVLKRLRTQVLRVNLYWGGKFGVAKRRPTHAADPDDPAYNWSIYDRTVAYGAQYGVKILFSIWGTPPWANGGAGLNHAPANPLDLQKFASAAAKRYGGTWPGEDGRSLPPVRMWAAWNEPNNPIFLSPQYRRAGSGWAIQSAVDYARICDAVYRGVHSTLLGAEKVACGVTGPRGNNNPSSSRPSVSPLAFLRALKKAGLKRFDVYAHHPYYGTPAEEPGKGLPLSSRGQPPTAVTLGNIGALLTELSRLYGPKHLWITEYGYQTNPPDRIFGVSFVQQAAYLKQAYAIARQNPRIDMMLWFLLRDEPILNGWQSGLETASGKRKPAFNAFRSLPH